MNSEYIAVIDSGIGGISVLKSLIKEFPDEQFLYYGDNDNSPYGEKSTRELLSITIKNIDYLMRYKLKALVLGCNTLSTNLLSEIKEYSSVPTFGIFPPVESCILSGNKTLLLATSKTVERYKELKGITVVGLKNLAKDIENHVTNLSLIDPIKHIYNDANEKNLIKPFAFNTIILGCTHYVFVKNKISDHFRPQKIISGDYFLIKNLKKFLSSRKSSVKNKGFKVLFVGKNAKNNQKFYVNGGH